MARRVWLAAGLAALPLAVPGGAGGQNTCELVDSRQVVSIETGTGRITYIGRPSFLCTDGSRVRADSAAVFQASSFSQLFGNVFFEDADRRLTADLAHYFSRDSRLLAWGNVRLANKADGTTIRGDTLVYLRANDIRPMDRLTVSGGRPHATLRLRGRDGSETDSEPPSPEPPEELPPPRGRVLPRDTVEVPSPRPEPGEPSPRGRGRGELPMPDSARPPPSPVRDTSEAVEREAGETETPAPQEADPAPRGAPRDTTATPYEVDADRIHLEGDTYFRAVGRVEIRRDGLNAFADSVEYSQLSGRLFLGTGARIEGETYTLTGATIDMLLSEDELREVVAREDAVLVSEAVRLDAPQIRVLLEAGVMDRLVAVGPAAPGAAPGREAPRPRERRGVDPVLPGPTEASADAPRPRAQAEDFLLVADSIDVAAPGEVLERLVAVGRARGESLGRDTLNTDETPEVGRRDWLEGDTVVATFARTGEPAAPRPRPATAEPERNVPRPPVAQLADTVAVEEEARDRYRLERLVARGDARSLYRLQPSDTTAAPGRLAIHYVRGHEITILMVDGEVERMEVEGPTQGIHVEPARRPGPRTTGQEPPPGSLASPLRGRGLRP